MKVTTGFMCPWCRESMLSINDFCGGNFLDIDHPSNVQAIKVWFHNGILLKSSAATADFTRQYIAEEIKNDEGGYQDWMHND